MFTGYTPLFAAIVAIFVTIPVSWIRKDTRMDLKTIVQATVEGSRSAIGVGISCIIIGVIIGCIWGYVRSLDRIFTEIYNVINNIPIIIYMTLAALVFGQSFRNMALA